MKKIGPILAIISGFITAAFAIFGLLVAEDVLTPNDFFGNYSSEVVKGASKVNTTVSVMYIILIVIGLIEMALGVAAFKNGGGVAAFILLVFFAISLTLSIIAGVNSKSWPTSGIISLVITALATVGLALGFVKK